MLGLGDDTYPGPSEPVGQKALRASGVCPKAERTRLRQRAEEEERDRQRQEQADGFTVADLVELYLSEVIEGRVVADFRTGERKCILGARKPKAQADPPYPLQRPCAGPGVP